MLEDTNSLDAPHIIMVSIAGHIIILMRTLRFPLTHIFRMSHTWVIGNSADAGISIKTEQNMSLFMKLKGT